MIISVKIMPESVDTDLDKLEKAVSEKIKEAIGTGDIKFERKEVAFGLKSVTALFGIDESYKDLDGLIETIRSLEGVNSAEINDMRRAVG
ncbi:MAG: hypothetical protein GWP09_02540 [Nitrospiraceae bacterium]|nr:hypothetical protein [Nitrospiraceae bacterium]